MGYLTPCDSFTSYHTTQVFSIGKRITCQPTGLMEYGHVQIGVGTFQLLIPIAKTVTLTLTIYT